MKTLVTGAAGFVGSNLVDRLLAVGHHVIGLDNFSTGQRQFLHKALAHPNFRLETGDILNKELLKSCMRDVEVVLHLAANADVRFGVDHPTRDFQQNAQGTLNVLEAMRICNVPTIAFASTGSVYGEASVIPTPENHPFPVQTSLYGAYQNWQPRALFRPTRRDSEFMHISFASYRSWENVTRTVM